MDAPARIREVARFALIALTGAYVGCSSEAPECAGVQGYGLVIEVTDADTGTPLCDATVHLDHEQYARTIESDGLEPCRYLGGTQEGTYQIEVSKEGYEASTAEVLVPPGTGCAGLEVQQVSIPLAAIP